MRAATLAVLAITTLAITTDAAADDKSLAASGATAAPMSALATGVFPRPPRSKPPANIPASEKVPGLFVVAPAAFNRRSSQGYVMVLGDATAAKEVAKGSGVSSDLATAGAMCFTEMMGRFGVNFDENDEPDLDLANWTSDLRSEVTLQSTVEHGPRQPVVAVHAERIVTSGTSISLDATDVWVDPVTRGTRLIAKASLPLTPLGTYADGSQRVYAARDGEQVHVVVVRTMSQDERHRSDALFATAHERVATSGCDHIRTTLRAKKGEAATASIVSTVQLGHSEKKADPSPATTPAEMRKQMIALMSEQRSRPLHISPSVSWPTREREALVTVSAGWDSRERNGFGSF